MLDFSTGALHLQSVHEYCLKSFVESGLSERCHNLWSVLDTVSCELSDLGRNRQMVVGVDINRKPGMRLESGLNMSDG